MPEPISDEELARLAQHYPMPERCYDDPSLERRMHSDHTTARLIDALRASRAEVERVRREDGAIIARLTGEREIAMADDERLRGDLEIAHGVRLDGVCEKHWNEAQRQEPERPA
jgi:hypothetical protein